MSRNLFPITDGSLHVNHKGALQFPTAINKYLHTEQANNTLLGPFPHNPFPDRTASSPLNLDDFIGVALPKKPDRDFHKLGWLLQDIGTWESEHKACPASSLMVVLGILFNTINMTISIAPDRVLEIQQEVEAWHDKTSMSRKQLESLIGKLQFASQVIRAGRVFLARLLDELRGSQKRGHFPVPDHIFQDFKWWDTIMPILNGMESIYLDIFFEPEALIDTDATLVGAGGVWKGHYFHAHFPAAIAGKPHIIAHLELLAFTVTLKAWPHPIANTKFMAHLDNMIAVSTIKSGHSRDPFVNARLWEITYLSALQNFEVRVTNTIPDLLSHWELGVAAKNSLETLTVLKTSPEPSSMMISLSSPITGNLLTHAPTYGSIFT